MPVGSRDRWPEDYELGRPGYPRAAVDGLAADATVLDLGAGTGKLTGVLVEAFGRVVAVEPAAAMRGCSSERARRSTRATAAPRGSR